jgi:hypothetical protein
MFMPGMCLASGNVYDFLQGACVHEYAAHERFLYVRESDEYPCDHANAHEPPLHDRAGMNGFNS